VKCGDPIGRRSRARPCPAFPTMTQRRRRIVQHKKLRRSAVSDHIDRIVDGRRLRQRVITQPRPKPDMDAWALFDVRHRGFWLLECQCNTGESERHSQSLAHAKWFSEHDGGRDDANDWHRKRTNGGGRSR